MPAFIKYIEETIPIYCFKWKINVCTWASPQHFMYWPISSSVSKNLYDHRWNEQISFFFGGGGDCVCIQYVHCENKVGVQNVLSKHNFEK